MEIPMADIPVEVKKARQSAAPVPSQAPELPAPPRRSPAASAIAIETTSIFADEERVRPGLRNGCACLRPISLVRVHSRQPPQFAHSLACDPPDLSIQFINNSLPGLPPLLYFSGG